MQLQRVDQVGCRVGCYLPVQIMNFFRQFFPPSWNFPDNLFELLLQIDNIVANGFLLRFRKCLKNARFDHLAICNGGNCETHRRANQSGAGFGSTFVQFLKFRFLSLVRLGLYRLTPFPVILAIESRGNCDAEILDEFLHIDGESACRTGRQAYRLGLLCIQEVIDETPVIGCREVLRPFGERCLYQGMPTDPGIAESEQVIPLVRHAGAEGNRLLRP